MVEIGVNPIQAQLPQNQQGNTTQQSGSLPPIGINNAPDNVIAATTNSNEANVRGDDAFRRSQSGSERPGIPSVSELSAGVSTRVAFDAGQAGRVVLEITSNNGQAIARIPSETLVEYLESQFRQQNGSVANSADGNGANS